MATWRCNPPQHNADLNCRANLQPHADYFRLCGFTLMNVISQS